jgi:hypothetical protein
MADTIKKDARRSFSNTVSAGLKSLGGRGKTFYVLEFKNNSQMHRAKTTKEIIVDYIELGRSPKCQIRFGEDCRTVSGVHCAIMREGDHYFVKHLSKSNPTLINGKPIADKYYINSGDELTLSYGGPIVGFIVPQNNLTSSIPLTRRLSLFREQAMRPYKRAIALLSVIMILSIVGLTYSLVDQRKSIAKAKADHIADSTANAESNKKIGALLLNDSKKNETIEDLIKQGKLTKNEADQYRRRIEELETLSLKHGEIESLYPSVYFIYVYKVQAKINGSWQTLSDDYSWTGAGFLLSDGRFVTARHMVESWYYPSNKLEYDLNDLITKGQGEIIAYFKAVSTTNTLQFSSNQFEFDRTKDQIVMDTLEGNSYQLTIPNMNDDWAFKNTSVKGLINADLSKSNNLSVADQLYTLGFPAGLGVNVSGVTPILADFKVTAPGLTNGFISTTKGSTYYGNSGGPVFLKTTNGIKAIGILSGTKGPGQTQGRVIPISKIK